MLLYPKLVCVLAIELDDFDRAYFDDVPRESLTAGKCTIKGGLFERIPLRRRFGLLDINVNWVSASLNT